MDRTDSAMDYTAHFRDGKQVGLEEHSRAHRFSCGFLRKGNLQPAEPAKFLFTAPDEPEASRDLSVVWP